LNVKRRFGSNSRMTIADLIISKPGIALAHPDETKRNTATDVVVSRENSFIGPGKPIDLKTNKKRGSIPQLQGSHT